MGNIPKPFLTAVFTASSHHPFRIPGQYEDVFPKGSLPIHQCIGYSDNALRNFFEYAKTQEWYRNTLFVITADHTNRHVTERYNNAKGLFEIPIAFYRPDNSLEGHRQSLICQTDIMPSVLAYLGYDKPIFAFGQDVLASNDGHFTVNYNHPLYQIFSDHLLLQFDGSQICAIYDFKQDPLLLNNINDSIAKLEENDTNKKEAQQMLLYLKAYIQQYISRMINDRLTVSPD